MSRPWQVWAVFAAGAVLVLAAMVLVTHQVLRLDGVEARARRRAAVEENVRLALWNMDSAMAPLIARESSRAPREYTAYHRLQRVYTKMYSAIGPDEILVPSRLLTTQPADVRLYFQVEPDGRVTSPQAPTGNMRDRAEADDPASSKRIETALRRLSALRERVDTAALAGTLPPPGETTTVNAVPLAPPDTPRDLETANALAPRQSAMAQTMLNTAEFQKRRVSNAQAQEAFQPGQALQEKQAASRAAEDESALSAAGTLRRITVPVNREVAGPFEARWVGGELLLARRASTEGRQVVQGCWLDWGRLSSRLLAGVADLLPGARLEATGAGTPVDTRMLASLPVRLLPGEVPVAEPGRWWTPMRVSLAVAWACVLAGAAAVGMLLRGTVALSDRRAAFVSAVTHELRTPLTTFRMYTEMLEAGMIEDQEKRAQYLATMRAEADRLGHLVENVLAYAQLERGAGAARLEDLSIAQLARRVLPRLQELSARADMTVCLRDNHGAESATALADPAAVERILYNLVDNAAKYARDAEDRRIHIEVSRNGRGVRLCVRDHGPGIDGAGRLFLPFRKSAGQAASSAPGVGLGLALSRRMARAMGGDLTVQRHEETGACLALDLPAAKNSPLLSRVTQGAPERLDEGAKEPDADADRPSLGSRGMKSGLME